MSTERQVEKRKEMESFNKEKKVITTLVEKTKNEQLIAQYFGSQAAAFEQKIRLTKAKRKYAIRKFFFLER